MTTAPPPQPGPRESSEPHSPHSGRIIAIASGKGGVGKTFFAVTLAHCLSRQGSRVLLFDGDLGLANVDIQLGLLPEVDLSAVATGRASLLDARLHYPEGNFDIVAGRSGSGALSALAPDALETLLGALRDLSARYDALIVDLGAGLERPVRRMAAFADTLLVVATDEPTSLTDAYAVLKLHVADARNADARLVINQASGLAAGARTAATLQRACSTFLKRTPPLAGVIRRDDHVRDAIRRQMLLTIRHPGCMAAADIQALAGSILRPPSGLHDPAPNNV